MAPTHPIRFGVQTGQQMVEWPVLLDLWRKCDRWGYDTLWAFDHFLPIFVDPDGPCLEGWTLLGALAQATTHARIGHLVTGNTYRNPCLLAKMAATVDHISDGRLVLGIGAGWFELEHRAFGIDFKTVRGRLDALDEACRIVKSLFTERQTTFRGKHYTVLEAMGNPKPRQRPHPPIMIGGTGRKVLLRIVAEHADMWNAAGEPDEFRALIDVIRRHGDAVRRDTDAIEKTVMLPLCYRASAEREQRVCKLIAGMRQVSPSDARRQIMIGGKDECLAKVAAYAAAGVTHFIFMTFAPYHTDEIQAFAEEVMPAART
jgi:F420-dependent oxidoreductase-like protein